MLVPAGELGAMFLALVWVLDCACRMRYDVGWVAFFPVFFYYCIPPLEKTVTKCFLPLKSSINY